jgi:hypothetical protein
MKSTQLSPDPGSTEAQVNQPSEPVLAELLRHGLLKPARPDATGGGTLLWLSHLQMCFAGSGIFTEWKEEAAQLAKALRAVQVERGISPSERDVGAPLWQATYTCDQWGKALQLRTAQCFSGPGLFCGSCGLDWLRSSWTRFEGHLCQRCSAQRR